MIRNVNKIALMMIVLSFCVAGVCFANTCDNVSNTGYPITEAAYVFRACIPVGADTGNSFNFVDLDGCNNEMDPIFVDTLHAVSCSSGWNMSSYSAGATLTCTLSSQSPTPGSFDVDITLDDSGCNNLGDDAQTTITKTVHAVGPVDIYGPSNWCKNASVEMCATYSPGVPYPDFFNEAQRHANFLIWYWKVQGAADSTYTKFAGPCSNGDGTKSVCSPSFSTPGKYTICVKAQRYNSVTSSYEPSGWDNIITKNVTVIGPEDVQCDSSGGGCNTGNCKVGGQQVAPSPDFHDPKVYSQYNPSGPGGNFIKSVVKCPIKPILKMFRFENCNSSNVTYHWHYTSPCGKTNCVDFGTSNTVNIDAFSTIVRSGSTDAWTYIVTDGGGNQYYFGVAPPVDGESVAPYLKGVDVNGNIIEGTFADTEEENNELGMKNTNGKNVFSIMTTTNQTLTVVEKDPTGTIRDTWIYDLSEDNEHVIKEYHPDGTIVEIAYTDGNPTGVSYSNSPTDLDFSITYGYTNGKLTSAAKGSKETLYAYETDKITVSEREVNTSTNITVTEYTYDTDTTTVTRKHIPADISKDQTTIYKYFLNALDEKTYLYSVTDPLDHVTKNCTYIPTGTTLSDGIEDTDYEFVDYNSPLKGKVFKTIDAANRVTEYNYDETTGLLLSIEYPEVAVYGNSHYQPTQTYSYYGDTQNPTSFIKTVMDTSGIYTYYERDPNEMHQVTAIKVDNQDHTDLQWSAMSSVKEYVYYNLDENEDPDPRKGMLKSETVPLIDGTTDNIKTYDYFYDETISEVTTQKLSTSPTKTYYQVWNGTTYEMVSGTYSVNIGTNSRTVTSTDADGRHILNVANKDEQTHEKTTSTVYAEDKFTMSVYDCCNLLSTADEDGRETHYAHDAIGRVTKVWTDISGQSETTPLVANTYDSFGNTSVVTTRSDSNTNSTRVTTYTFDKLNRVTNIDYPGDLGDEVFAYDVSGNMWYKCDGNNVKTLYEYDNLNRLFKIYYNYTGQLEPDDTPDYTGLTASVTYQYRNGGSQLFSVTDSSGTTGYTYDSKGRLESCTSPNISNRTVSYNYNNLGQKTRITTSITNGTFVVNYEYYANGWLKNVKKGTNLIASYLYDDVGNRTTLTYGNGSSEVFAYEETDPRYHLKTIDYAYKCDINSNIENHGGLKFTRDKSGNPLTWGSDEYTKSYEYDNNSRLKSANYPGHTTETWNYDWVGNRTNSGYAYNAADQLTASPGKSYEYYNNGNLHLINTDEKVFDYTYNNLVNTVTSGSNVSSMLWDTSGNRVRLTTSSSQVYDYLYDTTAGIPAVIEEITPGGSIYYIREPNGALLARVVNGSTIQYYHFDELGSTVFMTDSDAVLTDSYTYDAWGNVTSHSGNTSQPYQYVGKYGYYTHYQDVNLPYIQTGVRLYNPEIGRYMQRDPIKIALYSDYLYTINKPISYTDPSGNIVPAVLAAILLVKKTFDVGMSIGIGLITCYAAWECSKCLYNSYQFYSWAGANKKYDSGVYAAWIKKELPYTECIPICAYAGELFVANKLWKYLMKLVNGL